MHFSCYGRFSDHGLVRVDILCPVSRNIKENKYIRKTGNNFQDSFLVWSFGVFFCFNKAKENLQEIYGLI